MTYSFLRTRIGLRKNSFTLSMRYWRGPDDPTCDRYPKEIDGVEERLKSRFGWGLTVAVEPPDLDPGRHFDEKSRAKSHFIGA